MEKLFFVSSFWEDIPQVLPCLRKAPPTGFGYPLGGLCFSILGGLFQPPTLMGFTLQSFFLFFSGRACVSADPFRSCAFLHNLLGHAPALQRLAPTKKAEPLVALRGISSDRGRMLS
jgi:apolipoprotein N-acyltransferase